MVTIQWLNYQIDQQRRMISIVAPDLNVSSLKRKLRYAVSEQINPKLDNPN